MVVKIVAPNPVAPVAPNPVHQPGTVDLALHKAVSGSGYTGIYVPTNAVDGDPDTYWESTDNAFPQNITVDLGSTVSIGLGLLGSARPGPSGSRVQPVSAM